MCCIVIDCLKSEGDLEKFYEIDANTIPSVSNAITLSRNGNCTIQFHQADAHNMEYTKYYNYDLIVAANLLEHLYAPIEFLSHIYRFIRLGGLLVLSSNYNWQQSITPKSSWLGGIKQDGENVTCMDAITNTLSTHFTCISCACTNLIHVTQINSRHYDVNNVHVTFWKRIQ